MDTLRLFALDDEMEIRSAQLEDLERINEIYNYFVLNAFCTFDITPCPIEDRKTWFEDYRGNTSYRAFVAVESGRVVGWACTGKYRDHPAFQKTADLTIYIDPAHHKKGVGIALYSKLFEVTIQDGFFHVLLAAVALPNEGSIKLHKRFAMEEVGVFKEYGKKNGRYISSIWLQRVLST